MSWSVNIQLINKILSWFVNNLTIGKIATNFFFIYASSVNFTFDNPSIPGLEGHVRPLSRTDEKHNRINHEF